MSSRERVARDTKIFMRVMRGERQAAIAADVGLHPWQVKRIVASCRRDGLGTDTLVPTEEVRATLDPLQEAVADMAAIEHEPDNHSVHIGVTRLKIEAALRRQEYLAAIGLMPHLRQPSRACSPRRVAVGTVRDVTRRYQVEASEHPDRPAFVFTVPPEYIAAHLEAVVAGADVEVAACLRSDAIRATGAGRMVPPLRSFRQPSGELTNSQEPWHSGRPTIAVA